MDNPSGTSTNPATVGTQNNGPRRPPYGGGGYGGRGFGFPGMGMGMGMGVGMRPMGGQGSFLDPFMASLQWLHSLNYIIYTVGHMADMVGMNAHAIVQAIQAIEYTGFAGVAAATYYGLTSLGLLSDMNNISLTGAITGGVYGLARGRTMHSVVSSGAYLGIVATILGALSKFPMEYSGRDTKEKFLEKHEYHQLYNPDNHTLYKAPDRFHQYHHIIAALKERDIARKAGISHHGNNDDEDEGELLLLEESSEEASEDEE